MSTIGFDYAAGTAYLGVMDDDKVLFTATIPLQEDVHLFFCLLKDMMKDAIEQYGAESRVWLEKPWISAKINQYTGLVLMRMSTILEMAIYESGLQPEFVGAMVWRKAIYGSAKVPDKKEAARKYALEHFGFETKFKYEHNTCESLLIARYGELQRAKLIIT